ncbi:hypothetical protein IWGMT90018_33560 [Mycobacterium kiyosense]|nr:hypothetical protein IWGMT90018_33560 [Mycobacterium kiyosense]
MTTAPLWQDRADVVVIGMGVAGLAAALAAHRAGRRVVVLNKSAQLHGVTATHYAQGGIAVVLPDNDDSIDAHVADTLAAGAGLCDPDAVYSIVADGYRAVTELVGAGARFDESVSGGWDVTREGGHSRRRVVHAGGDATGAEVQRTLDHAARALDIRSSHVALRVLHDDSAVTGVLVRRPDGCGIIHAPAVILATGGLGHLYSATTNPDGSTGDGIALGLWAGVPVSDLEFIQFHPTMLFDASRGGGRRPLITEAIRGEGAILIDRQGNSITAGGASNGRSGSPRRGRSRHRRAAEGHRRPVRVPGRPRHPGFRCAVPDRHGLLPGGRHRPCAPTHSDRSRRPLQQLRWPGHRRVRPDRTRRALRGR